MAAKLKDIAQELNLSISTISRVVNGKGRVSQETRRRVLTAVKRYDYKPNELAQSLRLRDSKTIGVIVPDITNSFFANIIKGVQAVCKNDGYSVVACNSDYDVSLEEAALHLMLYKQVSGLVLASVGNTLDIVHSYKNMDIPVVFVNNMPPSTESCDTVMMNDVAASFNLTNELIERGYSEIGMITGSLSQPTGSNRLKGFTRAMEQAGIVIRDEWVKEGDFGASSGEKHMRAILNLPKRPRAMLISNNSMTYGAVLAARKMGVSIPSELAIAAFDAIDSTGLVTPSITSINQSPIEIGERAAEVIIERLADDRKDIYKSIVLMPVLFDGDSW